MSAAITECEKISAKKRLKYRKGIFLVWGQLRLIGLSLSFRSDQDKNEQSFPWQDPRGPVGPEQSFKDLPLDDLWFSVWTFIPPWVKSGGQTCGDGRSTLGGRSGGPDTDAQQRKHRKTRPVHPIQSMVPETPPCLQRAIGVFSTYFYSILWSYGHLAALWSMLLAVWCSCSGQKAVIIPLWATWSGTKEQTEMVSKQLVCVSS